MLVCLDGRRNLNVQQVCKAFDPHQKLNEFTKNIFAIHDDIPATDIGQVETCCLMAGQAFEAPPADESNLHHDGHIRNNVFKAVQALEDHHYWNLKGNRVRHWPTPPKLCEELVHRVTKVTQAKGILDLYAVDGTLAASAAKAGIPYVKASVQVLVVIMIAFSVVFLSMSLSISTVSADIIIIKLFD